MLRYPLKERQTSENPIHIYIWYILYWLVYYELHIVICYSFKIYVKNFWKISHVEGFLLPPKNASKELSNLTIYPQNLIVPLKGLNNSV